MKESALILFVLLLVLSGIYISHQEQILTVTRKEKTTLKKTNTEIRERLESASVIHAQKVKEAQEIINKTARERDDLGRKLAAEKMRCASLRSTVKTLSETLREEIQKGSEEHEAERNNLSQISEDF